MLESIRNFFIRRSPARDETFLALSVAAFIVFGWELRAFFYGLPAFLLSQTVGEILVVLAYMLATALFETLVVTYSLVALAIILPSGLLREGFSYKASFLVIASAAVFIHLQYVLTNQPKLNFVLGELGLFLALWLIPTLLTRCFAVVRKIVLEIFDRLTIFSYIYLPLGGFSLVVIALRLLW